jgi:putative transposase
MRGFTLQKNTAFEWAGVGYRIQALPPDGKVLLEAIATGGLSLHTKEELLEAYRQGAITFLDTSPKNPAQPLAFSRPLDEVPEPLRAAAARRQQYLRAIYEAGSPRFTKRNIEPIIRRVASEIGDPKPPSITSICRWHYQLIHTQDARALLPRYDLRGSRQRHASKEALLLLETVVEEAYRTSPMTSVGNIYARLLEKIEAENRGRLSIDQIRAPSLRTTYRLVSDITAYTKTTLREGKLVAERKFRLSALNAKAERPLERVEADHTPLDVFCIDPNTWLPLGRPTFTILIDVFSRFPLGYYLSFGAPSAAALVGALRHAILPKTLVDGGLSNLKTSGNWPCHGIPDVLVVDNGLEFHGVDLEGIALDLGITIQFCPKREPRFKGVVERFLKTVNYSFTHQLPGTSLAKFHLRGDYDPLKHALISLDELKQILEKWLLDVYAESVHRGIKTTPRKRWQEGAMSFEPRLPGSISTLQRRIGKSAERKLRRPGIELNGIRYNANSVAPIIRRYGEGVLVRVLYDPEDLGEVLVWGPDDEEPVVVPALDLEYAKGLTELQNSLIQQQVREYGAAASDRHAVYRARAEIAQQVEELMLSRKLSARKRAARIQGLCSAEPPAKIGPPATQQNRKAAKKAQGSPSSTDTELPPPLPRIEGVKKKRGQG